MKKELIGFDLDGTLSKSKQPISPKMGQLLIELLGQYTGAIITGGDYPQIEKDLIPKIGNNELLLARLYLLPTCGAKMFTYKNGVWQKKYSDEFSEKEKIYIAFDQALTENNFNPPAVYGPMIEDRETQITFSALGQNAPLEIKVNWDPDFAKRKKIKDSLEGLLPEFTIRIGGSTSIDITKKGIDKAYGMRKLSEITKVEFGKILFIGDALFPGGNDYAVKDIGIDCISTSGPEETEEIIKDLIE